MAGFRVLNNSLLNTNRNSNIKSLSTTGLDISDMLLSNTETGGIKRQNKNDHLTNYTNNRNVNVNQYGLEDIYDFVGHRGAQKGNAQRHPSYELTRNKLRQFAEIDMIEEVLETISDETICYDDRRYWCKPNEISIDIKDEVKESYKQNFYKIYDLFGFNDGIYAWNLFKKWLVDGFLAFEIIYNNLGTEIIGFREIDPKDLEYAGFDKSSNSTVWNYINPFTGKVSTLKDSQVIYISYTGIDSETRISYIQRLVRAFNILDSLEQAKLIFSVTNSVFNKVFTIPVTGKSKAQAKQSLSALKNHYREEVNFDNLSGELVIDGKRGLPFYKEYWFPEKGGERPQIDSLRNDGPDLSRLELDHFIKKFYVASKVPMNRFELEGGDRFNLGAPNDIERKEIKYSFFISRLRNIFQEIMVKPLWLQMCLDYPALATDSKFYSEVSIKYVKNNYFDELKKQDIIERRINFLDSLKRIEADGGNREPFFNTELLVKEILVKGKLDLNEDFLKKNKEMMDAIKDDDDDDSGGGGRRW